MVVSGMRTTFTEEMFRTELLGDEPPEVELLAEKSQQGEPSSIHVMMVKLLLRIGSFDRSPRRSH